MVVKNFISAIALKVKHVLRMANNSSDLKIDAFIFSKQKATQVRALISGTGLHVIISLEEMVTRRYVDRFSASDQEIIKYVLDDKSSLTAYFMHGQSVRVASKTYDKLSNNVMLKIAAFSNNSNIEFEIDPAELSRNKFLLQQFNKGDSYSIGFAAAESRIRTEQLEMLKAKQNFKNTSAK
jgi:hypothetical protein